MKSDIQVSVRILVEYASRSGDISLGFTGPSRPVEGIHGHQAIQHTRPENYTPEVPISHVTETETISLNIIGRIDGILEEHDRVIIDEIKTTYSDLEKLAGKENPSHWAQAKIYAYMYATAHHMDGIDAQITYYHLPTGEALEKRKSFSFPELERFFREIVDPYLEWMDKTISWECKRNESISALDFPFPQYRPGQRKMAVHVYRAIKDGTRLMVQAATGIGKTMAVLFPAIKARGQGKGAKIFFLTARTTGRAAAEQAMDELRQKGLRFKSLTITAKEKICPNPDKACTGEDCTYARGYYDRVGKAVEQTFLETDVYTRKAIEKAAAAYHVCPFEFSLDLSLWVDCIICDYNYVFDPRVFLRRFFLEKRTDHTLLIDEAHNLVDRSRDMYSGALRKKVLLDVRRLLKESLPSIYRSIGRINTWMVKARKECEEKGDVHSQQEASVDHYSQQKAPVDLYPRLRRFLKFSEDWLSENRPTPFRDDLLALYYDVHGFLRISEYYNEGHVTRSEKEKTDLLVKLFCIDPSSHLAGTLNRCRSVVFFSATITPADYFRHTLGCGENTPWLEVPSPFPAKHFSLMISDHISTYYHQRHQTKEDVYHAIRTVVRQRPGNYLVFFPSYEYLAMVYERFSAECPEVETIVQTPAMLEGKRDAFLERFSEDNPDSLVGFVVMGGVFGEGIDLVGERLSGAVIVGVGLPALSPERELIKDYYDRLSNNGFTYAYVYPGINRVFQAAGRVIRSEQDRGVVLLIDNRFTRTEYRSLFPGGWRPTVIRSNRAMAARLERFWNL
jgi:DNA excision repair protein ERCC-2